MSRAATQVTKGRAKVGNQPDRSSSPPLRLRRLWPPSPVSRKRPDRSRSPLLRGRGIRGSGVWALRVRCLVLAGRQCSRPACFDADRDCRRIWPHASPVRPAAILQTPEPRPLNRRPKALPCRPGRAWRYRHRGPSKNGGYIASEAKTHAVLGATIYSHARNPGFKREERRGKPAALCVPCGSVEGIDRVRTM
jgi:hypothetical protein